jgi:hypothetical protein
LGFALQTLRQRAKFPKLGNLELPISASTCSPGRRPQIGNNNIRPDEIENYVTDIRGMTPEQMKEPLAHLDFIDRDAVYARAIAACLERLPPKADWKRVTQIVEQHQTRCLELMRA